MNTYTLNDENSWEFIKKILRNGDWTEDQIENITPKQLKQVVSKINKTLKQISKKSSPMFEAWKTASDSIQALYIKKIEALAAESTDGTLDPAAVQAAFLECLALRESLNQTILTEIYDKNPII